MEQRQIRYGISKEWLLYISIFYFFIFRDYIEKLLFVFKYVDEAIALMAIPLFIIKLGRNGFKVVIENGRQMLWIIIFFISGIIGNVIYRYQPFIKVVLPDILLNLKFWLAMYTGSCIYEKFDVERYALKMFKHIRFITLLFTILILLDWRFNLFITDIRYGFRSTRLFFNHPTSVAAISAYIIALLMSIKDKIGKKGITYLVWWMLILCSTMRSKAWGASMAFILIYYFVYIRKRKITIRTLFIFVPLVLLLAWNQIEFYFFSDIQSDSARYQLLKKSIMIMKDYFPFGSGFGTFASYYSAVRYSPLYRIYGLTNVNGLIEGKAAFVSDSFWPMIIGQTGFIGTIAFGMIIWEIYKRIQRIRLINPMYYTAAFSILSYILISSMAESAFVHPLMLPMALWLGYLLKNKSRENI